MWNPRSLFRFLAPAAAPKRGANRVRRSPRGESLETRALMAVTPIHVGVTYLETDYLETGVDEVKDKFPDRFQLSFTGGAPDTELKELRISTDKDQDGYSVGDLIFDTKPGGRGTEGNHDFKVIRVESVHGQTITVSAQVEDGGQELILRFSNFKSGDLLEFSIDVDEILRNSPDLAIFNSRLDSSVSGQEFQDSILTAQFTAPHYENSSADGLFINDYGDPGSNFGLRLPPDEGPGGDSRPNRSAAAVGSVTQVPKPISIGGTVWIDNNLNLKRESGEVTLAGVQIALWKKDASGNFVDTGLRQTTDANGNYLFGTSLGLMPGDYQLRETQPSGLFSVGAVPGLVGNLTVGRASSDDILTDISIPLGDTQAIHYDFAEAQPAKVSGYVYRDDNHNGRRDSGEQGLSNVTVRLVPKNTLVASSSVEVKTNADGSYEFTNLSPGTYDIVEVTQPVGLQDGRDSAGTINGITVGTADEPGDALRQIRLEGGNSGIEYNFGELPLGSLSGYVYLAAPGQVCGSKDDGVSTPLSGVLIELYGENGTFIARTTTGADGSYRFADLPIGVYTIIETTPAGLLDGYSHVGKINGVTTGRSIDGGTIREISLGPGDDGERYDFCEGAPAVLSGYVYHDASNDGRRDAGEEAIAGTKVELIDASGQVIATTFTDATGYYRFEGVLPGTYSLRETQPIGFLDGLDTTGTISGATVGEAANPGDVISKIVIKQGQVGLQYNFGELRPASLSGYVYDDASNDGKRDSGEAGIGGVKLELINSNGQVVASTTTDSNGRYRFENLYPGSYSIRESQPVGYFDGLDSPGTIAGITVGKATNPGDLLSEIALAEGKDGIEYNFGELRPSSLSGHVYVDDNENCIREQDEPWLAGVVIHLLDVNGNEVARTVTDSQGQYRFDNLKPGVYTVVEEQPTGYFEGDAMPGSLGGDAVNPSRIGSVVIPAGTTAVNYDFCERTPAEISGTVYVDRDGNCEQDPNEPPIAGVRIDLYDATGQIIASTFTDDAGHYRFVNVPKGVYTLRETQPVGYFQGGQCAGSGGGDDTVDDVISKIPITFGDRLVEYNFHELEAAELSGIVWSETDLNRKLDTADTRLAGVTIELLDANGNLVQTTTTDTNGEYRFVGLKPGTYAVRERQPSGLFHGGQIAGSLGGNATVDDLITSIVLMGGAQGVRYDFAEFPPATISGVVFQDGDAITLENVPDPEDLRKYRDGILKPGDKPIAGVVLELRNVLGDPFNADRALPGMYPNGPIRVVTSADGTYEFKGLRPGSYHVYQVQPEDYIDGLDTAGSTGGTAVNAADKITDSDVVTLIKTLAIVPGTDPKSDAILNISLQAGGHSTGNNFSEIIVVPPKPVIPAPPIAPPPLQQNPPPPAPLSVAPPIPKVVGTGEILALRPPLVAEAEYAVTWHLSVINGGFPRGKGLAGQAAKVVSAQDYGMNFVEGDHRSGKWAIYDLDGKELEVGKEFTLGEEESQPLVGDFNGDGVEEVAVYKDGQWYVDLNGNGKWDAGDMWLRLGSKLDRPVVGDWDGDGKDDIGIFGPQWQRDAEAIVHDPGLPDPANFRRRNVTSTVSNRKPVEDKPRYLVRGDQGEMRADAIDHVFRYGEQPDTPLAGDWNGDGIDSIATFRAGKWMLDVDADGRWTKEDEKHQFGEVGDEPVVGDWNGDGIDDLGVIRGDVWIIDSDGDRRLTGNDKQIKIAKPSGDALPVVGDFNGDGKDEIGWYRKAG